jgi:ADP-ribose pyrophosphatase YjhB (NUDIX family)
MEDLSPIRKAGALIFSDKKMLVVRPKGKPFFLSPGGKYEDGEDAEMCLKRELFEELCVELKSFQRYKVFEIKKAATSNRPLLLELYFAEISGELKPSSEIEDLAWISRQDFESEKFILAPSFYEVIPCLIEEGLI